MHHLRLLTFVIVAAASMSAFAGKSLSLDTEIPPPKPIYELDLGEREDHILSPGYWMWNGKQHVWMHARWIEKREGYVWVPDQWLRRGEKWYLAAGHWVEDEDYEVAEVDSSVTTKPAASGANNAKKSKQKKAAVKKRVRKVNYRDPIKWPKPTRR